MKKHYRSTLAIGFALFSAVACSESEVATGGPTHDPSNNSQALLKSDLPRDPTPDITTQELATTVSGERAFAWEMYHQLTPKAENLFVSPYSISTALAMAYAAAGGTTKADMAKVLHFDLPDEKFHASYNALDLALQARNLPATDASPALELSVSNAFWPRKGREPLASYLDTLAVNYGTGVYPLDYAGDPESSRKAINTAVSDWTKQRIPELLAQGVITTDTTAVLTNTIYLFAPWQTPFKKSATAPAPFAGADGTSTNVDTMNGDVSGRYARGEGYQVLALPYRSGDLELVIVLPDTGSFATFESTLNDGRSAQLLAELKPSLMRLHLPKFSLRTAVNLNDALGALGMASAFDGSAEFPGLGTAQAPISDVVHEAFVEVSEAGTEAAAATAVVFRESAAPMPDAEVQVNHPFVFFVRDVPTNATLFVGRVQKLQ